MGPREVQSCLEVAVYRVSDAKITPRHPTLRPRALELASQANLEWVRLGRYYQDVERDPGEFDVPGDDALIASARSISRTSLTFTTGNEAD